MKGIATEPTPERSDSFHSLMTPAVAKLVFKRYELKPGSDNFHDHYDPDMEAPVYEEPTLGTTPQKELILQASMQQIKDYRDEEAYRLIKARLFYCCFFSNFFGMTLTLYALSETVLFQKYSPNKTAFYCSLVLYVPALVWFIYVFLPCKAERARRKKMQMAVRVRQHYERVRESIYFGHEDSDEEEFQNFEKEMRTGVRRSFLSFLSVKSNTSLNRESRNNRDSTGKISTVRTSYKGGSTSASGKAPGRASMELPKAPSRSSIKKPNSVAPAASSAPVHNATVKPSKASVKFTV